MGAAALVSATILVGAGSATAAPTSPQDPDACAYGHVCAYRDVRAIGKIWTSPGCGFFNLGNMGLGDRISSIVMYLNGQNPSAQAYNWGGSAGWIKVGPLIIWPTNSYSYWGSENDIIDAVQVNC
jgi:hypothetical protein